ncbi:hypothetical protein VII00023_13297 [Vibrio ichthyoenteri ATCC 700023]|uniref:Uncharacterized protein n=1 Tax=Vibrio ichthyoenteri ATCC 700023 TaxID=870968 RepID=F9S3P9_9VIBR|nr:hypothetical protein VII00023_13297 [Vibrio ichthyoenteri ATCC 700023]
MVTGRRENGGEQLTHRHRMNDMAHETASRDYKHLSEESEMLCEYSAGVGML